MGHVKDFRLSPRSSCKEVSGMDVLVRIVLRETLSGCRSSTTGLGAIRATSPVTQMSDDEAWIREEEVTTEVDRFKSR